MVMSEIVWLTYCISLSVLHEIGSPAFLFLVALNVFALSDDDDDNDDDRLF